MPFLTFGLPSVLRGRILCGVLLLLSAVQVGKLFAPAVAGAVAGDDARNADAVEELPEPIAPSERVAVPFLSEAAELMPIPPAALLSERKWRLVRSLFSRSCLRI